MEEKKEVTHSLHLEQRGHGLITGVTEMKSFDEENIFIPVIIDKSNDVIDFDIDHYHISCTKQNLKILLENLL